MRRRNREPEVHEPGRIESTVQGLKRPELGEGEELLLSGRAFYLLDFPPPDGWLWLTTRRLVFEVSRLSIYRANMISTEFPVEVPLEDVISVKCGFSLRMLFRYQWPRSNFVTKRRSGWTQRFHVEDAGRWRVAIEALLADRGA